MICLAGSKCGKSPEQPTCSGDFPPAASLLRRDCPDIKKYTQIFDKEIG
ncbi:MAG: hypothetical protein K2P04_10175 [Oscillospiraceae bacterium]|nr:hypothetical protein [Oscillospiraceae bacterium]